MQQDNEKLQDLSDLHSALHRVLTDIERSLEVILEHTPLVKGSVYEMARKCGRPSCACTSGKLHRGMALSWSDQGKSRLLSIPPNRLAELREKSQNYARFRRARSQVSQAHKEILALVDGIQKLRREVL